MVRDELTDREREERRKQAVEATQRGFDRNEVAEMFGVTSHAVWEWMQVYDEHGMSGLEAYNQSKEYLQNTSSNLLFDMLTEAEDSKATQKIMISLVYKNSNLSKKHISEMFGITAGTVRNWLSELEGLNNNSLDILIKKISSNKNGSKFELEPRERTRRELAVRRKEAITLLSRGFSAARVSLIFDVCESTVRKWKYEYKKKGWEGLEHKNYSTNNSEKFENISKESLLEMLSEVKRSKPTQKIMLAINYKEEDYITQEDIGQRYRLGRQKVSEWLSDVDRCKTLRPERALRDEYHVRHEINEYEIPNKTTQELDVIRKESIRLLAKGYSIESVSEIFDFSAENIQRWAQIYDEDGWEGLDSANLSAGEPIKRDAEDVGRIECVEISDLYSELNNIGDYPTRRLVAGILHKKGALIPEVADLIDASPTTVNRWFDEMEEKPIVDAVQRDSITGRPMKLSEDKLPELENALDDGPTSHGFVGQVWTGKRVAKVIEEQFDVSVSTSTARNYLRKLGWSNKKPRRRSTERDEEEIEEFLSEIWKEIRQDGKEQNKSIVFVDESKFRIMPTFKKTWAPVGETATVETSGLFEYVAVIGALVYRPETHGMNFYWEKQRYNFNTKSVLNFLQNIIKKLSQEPIFLLDNLAAHKSAVNEIENKSEEESLQVEWFPKHASDINPVDNVWGHAKYNELANYAPKNLDELELKVDETLSDIQTDDSVLRYCIKDTGLEIEA